MITNQILVLEALRFTNNAFHTIRDIAWSEKATLETLAIARQELETATAKVMHLEARLKGIPDPAEDR